MLPFNKYTSKNSFVRVFIIVYAKAETKCCRPGSSKYNAGVLLVTYQKNRNNYSLSYFHVCILFLGFLTELVSPITEKKMFPQRL